MDELERAIEKVLARHPQRVLLSAPRRVAPPGGEAGTQAEPPAPAPKEATARRLAAGWQLESRTATQAFHQNVAEAELPALLCAQLRQHFLQLTAYTNDREWMVRLTKKGRVLENCVPRAAQAVAPDDEETAVAATVGHHHTEDTHDRPKRRLLAEGVAVPALVDIGVMTADGRPVAAKRAKWRQINRFLEMVADALGKTPPRRLRVVDFGCGKSALTFVLYHYLTGVRGIETEMTGLDLRADVVAGCNKAAEKYGYHSLHFEVGDIAAWGGQGADMVVSLHACDTATDHALARAVALGAGIVLSVPCCQHELNAQLKSDELALLSRYGIVKERAAALMTDAVRANLLCACGYRTQLLEFVDLEDTPKNILIRAVKADIPKRERRRALDEVQRLAAAFSLAPCLLELLKKPLAEINKS